MTECQIFSLCRRLVGHFPVAGWLRITSSFVKRGFRGNGLDSFADRVAIERLKEVLFRLRLMTQLKESGQFLPLELQTYGVMLVRLLAVLL